jgi:hypothetical protein
VTAGTPAVTLSVLPPTIPTSRAISNVSLAYVYVPAGDTAVNAKQIIDGRAWVLGQSPTFNGKVTVGSLAASGSCRTKAELDALTPVLGAIECCSDCTIGTGPTTDCATSGTVGTVAFTVNAGAPVWRCW